MTDRLARLFVAVIASMVVSLALGAGLALWRECAPPWRCHVAGWPPHLALEYRP